MMAGLQQNPGRGAGPGGREHVHVASAGLADGCTGCVDVMHASGVALILILFARTVVRLVGIIGLWKGRRWKLHGVCAGPDERASSCHTWCCPGA